jgi:lysophospholipase L1-like esterase
VTVARGRSGASIAGGSLRRVSFGGRRDVTLAPGEDRRSDPVRLRIRAGQRLALSAFLPGDQSPTVHRDAEEVSYLSPAGAGDVAGAEGPAPFTQETGAWIAVEAVDVHRARPGPTVVTLGDSLTDGLRSGDGAEARYPDVLARRGTVKRSGALIVNAGVTGDRLGAPSEVQTGPSALTRLRADALSQPSLGGVIVEEGINDLRGNRDLTAGSLIASLKRIASRLRRHHVPFMLATLGPTGGDPFTGDWVTPRRLKVNDWIRGRPTRETVDFDRILRDPSDPLRLLPAYDSGDHIHPNAAGYAAMARGVRLGRLLGHR